MSFDHTTGRLVIEGTATVSADGLTATTDPGSGITKPGWHGLTPPGEEREWESDNDGADNDDDGDGIPDEQDELNEDQDPDGDGLPNRDDPDDDNDGEPDNPPEPPPPSDKKIEISIGIGLSDKGIPRFTAGAEFGIQLPRFIFGDPKDDPDTFVQPALLRDYWEVPKEPISAGFSTTFVMSEKYAYYVPTGELGLFKAVGNVILEGGLGLSGSVRVTANNPIAKITASVLGGVSLGAGFQITHPLLCALPLNLGKYLCKPHRIDDIPIFGIGRQKIEDRSLPLPLKPVLNFSDGVSATARLFAELSVTLAPKISISKAAISTRYSGGEAESEEFDPTISDLKG